MFWSEIGLGFGEPGGTSLPRISSTNPPPPRLSGLITMEGMTASNTFYQLDNDQFIRHPLLHSHGSYSP